MISPRRFVPPARQRDVRSDLGSEIFVSSGTMFLIVSKVQFTLRHFPTRSGGSEELNCGQGFIETEVKGVWFQRRWAHKRAPGRPKCGSRGDQSPRKNIFFSLSCWVLLSCSIRSKNAPLESTFQDKDYIFSCLPFSDHWSKHWFFFCSYAYGFNRKPEQFPFILLSYTFK